MPDPFDFRWGPGRLVGMGINLHTDQAACTETPGYALAVAPLLDPTGEEPFQITDNAGLPVCIPQPIEVMLNTEMPTTVWYEVNGKRAHKDQMVAVQDFLDGHTDPSWRRFAQTVSEYDQDGDNVLTSWLEEGPANRFVWDTVMVDADQHRRLQNGVVAAYNASQYPLWEHYQHIRMNGVDCDESHGDDCDCGWTQLAQAFGISSALDEDCGWPLEEPEWITGLVVPDFAAHLDPDLLGLWERLQKSSRKNWSAFETATKSPIPPTGYGAHYRNRLDTNLWR